MLALEIGLPRCCRDKVKRWGYGFLLVLVVLHPVAKNRAIESLIPVEKK
jgi:hypothetical protein